MVGLNDDDNSKRLSYLVRVPLLVYTDADTGVAMIKIRRLSNNDNNYDDDNSNRLSHQMGLV